MTAVTVGTGLVRLWMGTLGRVPDPPPMDHIGETQAVTVFLLLHAFSSGTTALTGVEAISTGITAFKEPRSRNAGHHAAVDGGHPRRLLPGHQLPGGAASASWARSRRR